MDAMRDRRPRVRGFGAVGDTRPETTPAPGRSVRTWTTPQQADPLARLLARSVVERARQEPAAVATGAAARALESMQDSFDADFSEVRIRAESPSAARLGALAYTCGEAVHFAPGHFDPGSERGRMLLGHELAHVVQQRQGRVRGTAGGALNLDSRLEAEADVLGARAMRGERAMTSPTNGTAAGDVVQAKLGFELELLVNADKKGKKIASGDPIGTYGAHLLLTADEAPTIASVTPYSQSWVDVFICQGGTFASRSAAEVAYPGKPIVAKFMNRETREHADVKPPDTNYATILEIVTKAYEPETAGGRANIIAAMNEAVALAAAIETHTEDWTQRVPVSRTGALAASDVYVGNEANPGQSTDASIQATFAVAIDQLGTYLTSTVMGKDPRREYGLKHHSDTADTEGERALAELPTAAHDAATVVDDMLTSFGGLDDIRRGAASEIRGFLTLVCQYLRMSRYFFDAEGAPLDKNIVPLLSRTNLSVIRRDVVQWNPSTVEAGRFATRLLTATGRAADSSLANLPDQSLTTGLTCKQFLRKVLLEGDDGVTELLGKFKKMGPERIRRDSDPQATKVGPVFELRNLIRHSAEGSRFAKSRWVRLAEHHMYLLQTINARDKEPRDQRVDWVGYGPVGGAHRGDTETV